MHSNRKPTLLIWYRCSIENAERLITLIGNQPFYVSSGKNSGLPGTLLPFGGFQTKLPPLEIRKFVKRSPGHLVKPYSEGGYKSCYPPILLSFFSACPISEEIYSRMGNLKTLLISYIFGNGCWATDGSCQQLGEFLEIHFGLQITRLRKKYDALIKEIRIEANAKEKKRKGEIVIDLFKPNRKILELTEENEKQWEAIGGQVAEINKKLAAASTFSEEGQHLTIQENDDINTIDYTMDFHSPEFDFTNKNQVERRTFKKRIWDKLTLTDTNPHSSSLKNIKQQFKKILTDPTFEFTSLEAKKYQNFMELICALNSLDADVKTKFDATCAQSFVSLIDAVFNPNEEDKDKKKAALEKFASQTMIFLNSLGKSQNQNLSKLLNALIMVAETILMVFFSLSLSTVGGIFFKPKPNIGSQITEVNSISRFILVGIG